jgi:hypothetical protein
MSTKELRYPVRHVFRAVCVAIARVMLARAGLSDSIVGLFVWLGFSSTP